MSLITQDKEILQEYITNQLLEGKNVAIYERKIAPAVLCPEITIQYIATGLDSDIPTGAKFIRLETPVRSSVYDHSV